MARDIDYGDYACYLNDTAKNIADSMNVTLKSCGDFSKTECE